MAIIGKTVAVMVSAATPAGELDTALAELAGEGVELVIVGPDMEALEALCLDGRRPITAGMAVAAAKEVWFDGLLILDGAEAFLENELALDFVSGFETGRKPIAALGSGIRLLLATELAEGRHLAAPVELAPAVEGAGAVLALSPLFKENRWITAHGEPQAAAVAESLVCALADVKLSARDMENPITD